MLQRLSMHAGVDGIRLNPFFMDDMMSLCVVGHHPAYGEIKGLRFSGLFAWFLWRGIYLAKLPSLERKVRVSVDWLVELFFPRDIVQTIDFNEREAESGQLSVAPQPDQSERTVSMTAH